MKYLYLSLLCAALFFSCKNRGGQVSFEDVDSYIEQFPDSALAVLSKIDNSKLGNRKLRAKHALLLSIALDKNYIDKTDFSVLQPAIDYYERKGNHTDRLRMYYYQGRIYINAKNDEKAMVSYSKALEFAENSTDQLTLARLYLSKGKIHNRIYEFDTYAECSLSAADLFITQGKISSGFNALYSAMNGYQLMNDSIKAYEILARMEGMSESLSAKQLSRYYEALVSLKANNCNYDTMAPIIGKYQTKVPEHLVEWLSLSNVYLKLNMEDKGIDALEKHCKYSNAKDARYYAIASSLYERSGNGEKALEYYKNYIKLTDSADLAIFRQDTKFIEERHSLQLDNLKLKQSKQLTLLICFISIIVLASTVVYIYNRLKITSLEKKNFSLLCGQLITEKNMLLQTLEAKWVVNSSVKDVILKRLELLNSFIATLFSRNDVIDKESKQFLMSLINRHDDFLSSTVLAFEASHPQFITFLKDKGLSPLELGYCCLYAMGLNGKGIGEFTKMSRHYIISHEIRKKLGLSENNPNLNKYITNLLETYSKT